VLAWSAFTALCQGIGSAFLAITIYRVVSARDLDAWSISALGFAALARTLSSWSSAKPARVARNYVTQVREQLLKPGARLKTPSSAEDLKVVTPSEILTATTAGADALGRWLAEVLPAITAALIASVVSTALIASFDGISAIIAWAPLLFMPVIAIRISKRSGPVLATSWRRVASITSRFSEIVSVLPTLRATGGLKRSVAELDAASSALEESTSKAMRYALANSLGLEFLAGLSIGFVAMDLGFRLLAGSVSLATAFAILVMVPELTGPARRLGAASHSDRDAKIAKESIDRVIAAQTDRHSSTSHRDLQALTSAELRIEGLSFAWSESTVLFENFNLRLEAGDHLVIEGESGCGKSTLLQLIAGLLEAQQGLVALNSTPAAETSGAVLVPAKPRIFNASFRENLELGRSCSADDLEQAIELVGLRPLIARLPQGLGSLLGHDGRPISAGEAQRIGIARAMLADPCLLLLDEPTAHLDQTAREELQERLTDWLSKRTVIVAAHGPTLLAIGTTRLALPRQLGKS
ncbi:MAG: ATP-binding cassette domain-containing protein, partial [Actinomycetota bacterium]